MKTVRFFAMAFIAAASIPLMAQQVNATGQQESSTGATSTQTNDSTHGNSHANTHGNTSANASPRGIDANGSAGGSSNAHASQGPVGFGDEASSRAYEMSSVTGELQNKLDSKSAKVGDRVILKTTEKVQTADGTVIPRGTRLVGHITQVQTRDSTHAVSQMGITFDRAELKNGQNLAIHTLIRGVNPNPGMMATNDDDSMSVLNATPGGVPMTGGGRSGRSGGGTSGLVGGAVQTTAATTSAVSQTTSAVSDPARATGGAITEEPVALPGRGDLNSTIGAHQAAAARAVPHATAIPGVMLAGNSSDSGVFSASKKNIQFDNGTQMELGIVADR